MVLKKYLIQFTTTKKKETIYFYEYYLLSLSEIKLYFRLGAINLKTATLIYSDVIL